MRRETEGKISRERERKKERKKLKEKEEGEVIFQIFVNLSIEKIKFSMEVVERKSNKKVKIFADLEF